jgi:hypothetical protein
MESLRYQVRDLASEIVDDIHHGECFYEKEMFNDFISKLERMKELGLAYYRENQED